jgi:hypothetical protein
VDDPLGRIVMRYAYDMLGNRIHQLSMEAGARWMLNDVAGKPIRAWDSRGHNFTTNTTRCAVQSSRPCVAPLQAVTPTHARLAATDWSTRSNMANHWPLPNHSTCVPASISTSDSAGVATNARLDANGNPIEAYDFKGNLLRSTRRLVTRLLGDS